MSEMLDFCLSLLQGAVILISNGPMLYLTGFVLFAIIVNVFLSILRCGVANFDERRK